MNTLYRKLTQCIFFGAALFGLSGCFLPSCQELPEAPFASITETAWRLVYTTNTQAQTRTNITNFTIVQMDNFFNITFTSVVNNQQSGTPEVVGSYDIPQDGILVAQLQDFQGNDLGTVTWSYELGRKLVLTDLSNGDMYYFYPFEGVISPDRAQKCEFKGVPNI